MHRRLQFGMRGNPASDRRHGSRVAVSTKSGPYASAKEDSREGAKLAFADSDPANAHSSAYAAGTPAATAGKDRGENAVQREPRHAPMVVETPLTCKEAAALIRVHPKTVKRMARSGDLPGHFRFGRWFFYASELDLWMRTGLHSSRHSCR